MDLHTHIPYRLAQLSMRIRDATTGRFVRGTDISVREWRVLGMLGIKGDLTPSDLATLTGMDRATITRASAKLQRLGYIHRNPNPNDSRSLTIGVTARGRKLCDSIVPRMAGSGEECRALYSAGEFSLFIELLDRLDVAIAENRVFAEQKKERA